jgi:N-acyl-D-amino-acid deacylase
MFSDCRFARLASAALGAAACGLVVVLIAFGTAAAAVPEADIVIRGGMVYDGSAPEPLAGDVVIAGDTVVYVGPRSQERYRVRRVVDAKGLVVAPGFIDPHGHPDTFVEATGARARLVLPWLMQGVTTVFTGVDGAGPPGFPTDVAGFFRSLGRRPAGVNLATYVGFGAVRASVLGATARAPAPAELERMQALVARGVCDGALGLSTGLFYPAQSFASTEEVVTLAREAARHGGIYDSHLRDESSYTVGLVAAVQEAIRIGEEGGLPVHIAHIKALGVDVQGKAAEIVALVEAARARGQDVTADQYPWDASGTSLEAALIPRWAFDGGRTRMLARFDDAATIDRLKAEMADNLRRRGGADSLVPVSEGRPWSGKRLSEIAASWGVDPLAAALRIMREQADDTPAISYNMAERDIELFMRQPWVVTSTDGSTGHPRMYATYPRKYARYVIEKQVLSLAEFINGSTARTADMFGLAHRGHLRPGDFADVVVFDPARFRPRADYLHPRVLSEGVVALLVNGRLAVDRGVPTGIAAGRAIRRTPLPGSCTRR